VKRAHPTLRLWIARLLIGAVLGMNIHSAVAFFVDPKRYAPAYELTGISGESAIQGFGVLFLMWNVPYLVAFLHPQRYRVSLMEAIAMQSIGLGGEYLILRGLPPGHPALYDSISRFIFFDVAGLAALFIAAWATFQRYARG